MKIEHTIPLHKQDLKSISSNTLFLYLTPLSSILLLFVFPFLLQSQHQNFENPLIFNSNNGIKVGAIRDVVLDKQGFLWIAGSNGLQRFDGHYFKHYTHQEGDSLPLLTNDINDLYYDEVKHQLWMATGNYGGGLSILDLATERFKNYKHDPNNSTLVTSSELDWIYKDKFDTYWISSKKNGLIKYLPESDAFKPYHFPLTLSDSNTDFSFLNEMTSYAPDVLNDSLLWIGTMAGLLKFNVVTEQFTRYSQKDITTKSRIRSLYHHTNNKVYFETWAKEGLLSFDPETEAFEACEFQGFSKAKGERINNIRQLYPKSKDQLWVMTIAGLITYDVVQNKVLDFKKNKIQNAQVYGSRFFKDKNNRIILWRSGNHTNDLHIYTPILQQIRNYPYESDQLNSNFIVRRMLEEDDKLWIAAQMSEGLYQLDLQTGKWTLFPAPKTYFQQNSHFGCWDILRTKDGDLLILEASTIYRFSEQDQKLIPWELTPNVKDPKFRRMIEDRRGNIWVGAYNKEGVFRINPKNKNIQQFKKELIPFTNYSTGAIIDLQEDKSGNIWIRSSKYSVYNYALDTFYLFPKFSNNQKKNYYINSLGLDGSGNVWIATDAGIVGITYANHPEKGIVEYLDKSDGLKANDLYRLATDHRQNMWILSDGLHKINPDRTSVQYFEPTYIQKGDLSTIYPLSAGRMALGYRKGIGIFHPDSLTINKTAVQPYVHSFKVFDKELKLEAPLLQNRQVDLKHNENFFSLEISALDPSFFGNLEFMYQLEGVDVDWVSPKNRNYVAYTNIKSGSYTFKLKAKTSEGIWNETPYQLQIHIATPWYKTWWAYALLLCTVIGAAYWFYRFQLSRKLAVEKSQRLQEINQLKTNLYNNITHEFRTPLTVILGMTENLQAQASVQEVENMNQSLKMIERNGQNLLQLVNEMLDLAKLESGNLELNLQQADIIPFIKYLGESFHSLAEEKHIHLSIHSEKQSFLMDFDATKLASIISNLLSNAIKFTPAGGSVLVHLKTQSVAEQAYFLIQIKDTGKGIAAEAIPHIFDRFYQADASSIRAYEGTGIGLALTKELVDLLKGIIEVKSELGKGSEFVVQLPITRNTAFAESPISIKASTKAIPNSETYDAEILTNEENDLPLVLIIEDNKDVAHYIGTCLQGKYQYLYATNGKIGIEMALERIPDLIISDVMMPEKDGFEVCASLKTDERTNHIPIILLTAKVTVQDRLTGLSHGADAYLAKPFEKEELWIRLHQLLELRKTLQKKYSEQLLAAPDDATSVQTEDPFIAKARAIVLAELENEDFSLHELSQQLFLSRSQVHRKLKAVTGMSATIFIRTIRLQEARKLLIATELTVAEIAHRVGFKTSRYFSQTFKEMFEVRPSDLRKAR